jgi:putative membrane protein
MPRYLSKWVSLTFTCVGLAVAACGGDDDGNVPIVEDGGADGETDGDANVVTRPDVSIDGGGADADADAATTTTMDGDAEASATDAEASVSDSDAPPLLSDNEIATVLFTTNTGEIQAGNLALMRAIATQARAFANMMITDHTAANLQLAGLFESPDAGDAADGGLLDARVSADGGFPIDPSWLSQQLVQENTLAMQQLMLVTGRSFDLAYLSNQVAVHSEVLNLIDGILTPESQNPALKAQIAATRTVVAAHLATAISDLNAVAATPPSD